MSFSSQNFKKSRSHRGLFQFDPQWDDNNGVGYSMKNQYDDIELINILPQTAPLRAQLAFNFPYDKHSPIPQTIFQTWRVDVNDKDFPANLKAPYNSWSDKNENHTHTLIPDNMLDDWIKTEFENVPDIIKAWNLLPKIILKADFFRYLVIFARGGVYSDLDTRCLKPISQWAMFQPQFRNEDDHYKKGKTFGVDKKSPPPPPPPPPPKDTQYDEIDGHGGEIGCVLGIEADPDRPDWADWYARRIQFVQWTIMAKKGHPMLRELIARVVEETLRKEQMGTLKTIEGKDAGGDIMHWTGPGIYTDTAFDYLNNVISRGQSGTGFGIGSRSWKDGKKWNLKEKELDDDKMPLFSDEMEINWKTFSGMERPAIVDDIMILPITGFSPGVGQMGSKSVSHPLAFVKHLFEGSWKPKKERMH